MISKKELVKIREKAKKLDDTKIIAMELYSSQPG